MVDSPPPRSSSTDTLSRIDILAALGMGVLLILVLIRALSMHEPFPMWNADPYLMSSNISGITDGFATLLSVCMITTSLAVYVCSADLNSRRERISSVLLGIGFLGIAYHLYGNIEHAVNGLTIASMLSVMISSRAFVMRYPYWNRVIIPILLGFGCLLTVYGFHQILIQHPLTVDTYEQGRESFLAARGWAEGSFEQLSFERRLNQAEATGWFGLSNVFASFMAAISVAFFTIGLASLKRSWWIVCMIVGGVLFSLLVMSKSKGGIGAAVLGFGVIQYSLARQSGRTNRLGSSTLSSCVLVIIGVFAGSLMQQLSLLFRSQYIVGSLNIFKEHPMIGVGPNGFQGAYMIHKPSTSPEDVTSAHNFFFDLLAQFGIFGILMVVALCTMIYWANTPSRNNTNEATTQSDSPSEELISKRVIIRTVSLIVIISGVSMIRIQTQALSLDLMILLLIGAVLWGMTGVLSALLSDLRTLRLAACASAVVLLMHAMLDVTPVCIVSAPLFGLFVGVGLLPKLQDSTNESNPAKAFRTPVAVVGMCFLAVIATGSLASFKLLDRDRVLIDLAQPANQILELRTSLNTGGPTPELSQSISLMIGQQVRMNEASMTQALNQLELQSRVSSASRLRELTERIDDSKLRVTAIEQTMKAASFLGLANQAEECERHWQIVEQMASDLEDQGTTFRELNWAGQSSMALAMRYPLDVALGSTYRLRAIEAWERADLLNPNDPKSAVRIMDAYEQAGNSERAVFWASEALGRSEQMKLDPLKQLRGGVLDRVRAVAGVQE